MNVDEALEQVESRAESRDLYDGADNDPACLGRHFWTADLQAMEVLADEVERLQSVVADQALTIGTMKDELEVERQRLATCGVAADGYR